MLQQVAAVCQRRLAEARLAHHQWWLEGELFSQQNVKVELFYSRVQRVLLGKKRGYCGFVDFQLNLVNPSVHLHKL